MLANGLRSTVSSLNQDFRDLLAELIAAEARFLVIGAHALAALGAPRSTGDLDVWIEASDKNARRVWQALASFGAPLEATGLTLGDLATPGVVYQIGQPPRRIDILTEISGVAFETAWPGRQVLTVDGLEVPFVGREAFVVNKRASGRTKDLLDLELLHEAEGGS